MEEGCRSGILLRVNAEFLHAREESRALRSQPRGGAVGATYASFARGKCPYDFIELLSCICSVPATRIDWTFHSVAALAPGTCTVNKRRSIDEVAWSDSELCFAMRII